MADFEKGLQALEQISATGQEAIKQIQAQGGIDQKLPETKGQQALEQIGAQGNVDMGLQIKRCAGS